MGDVDFEVLVRVGFASISQWVGRGVLAMKSVKG